ncbi:serine/threonine-protein phosphatase 2A activator-like isoform X2 [Oratosquilla oratoria]|uniref:serine/threonine-protein phosphatase 2A activator-like isoform X2 n=1 Tax=Oratosquilla oratoria TaxID=337810 RepID=UPI003F771102
MMKAATHTFQIPKKEVLSPADVEKWEKSEAYQDILGFLMSLNAAVKGKKLSVSTEVSSVTEGILDLLIKLGRWIDEIPPVNQPQRFGNKAFRNFYTKLKEEGAEALKQVLPEKYHPAVPEVSVYLIESVGNSTRIDYGTGHELAFIMFLTCLFKIGALKQEDSVATVTKIFYSYLDLARKLQTTYKMEPAGSQGVWSLDDFQFVPFIWGSSQLFMNPKIAPEMFVSEKVVHENHEEFMFLQCIKFIMMVKTGPFAEHSHQLWNISGVQSWAKINQGLVKMYKAEVLHKFPVIQHVLFGSLLSIKTATEIQFHPPCPDLPGMRSVGGGIPYSNKAPGGTMPLVDKMPPVNRMPPVDTVPPIGRMPPMDTMPLAGRMPPPNASP